MTTALAPQVAEQIDALDLIRLSAPPPFSIEVQGTEDSGAQTAEADNLLNDLGAPPEIDQTTKAAMSALYGPDFPLLDLEPDLDDWARWADNLWDRHRNSVSLLLHLIERNRLFRHSMQWISSVRLGTWREPPKPRDAARVTRNMIAPALDQRVQIISEQRPGFRVRPETLDIIKAKKAEAKQVALEYQWDQQGMSNIVRELAYWSGTDGVAFYEMYWDPERGPWDELYGEGGAYGKGGPLGEITGRVRRIEQVRVSPEATANQLPMYLVIREVISLAEAVSEYGPDVVENISYEKTETLSESAYTFNRLGYTNPTHDELLREQDTVDRITVYCQRSSFLQKGMHLIVVGKKVVFQGPLLWGVIPVIRFTDGSTDPSYFPMAVMNQWIDAQMRVNAILSKWVENVRLNAGPRLIGKSHSIVGETLLGGTMSLIEVKGLGNISDLVRPVEGFSLSQDAKELLALEIKAFEDLSGWNDVSRGQFSAEQSGRAILAIREQLERIFAPSINAAADAMKQWAKVSCAGMAWGYDVPRTIAVQGQNRPDLAMVLVASDLDGVLDVEIDPETLMPMPRALKMMLLDNHFDRGVMGPQEYRRRSVFSWTRNLNTPDEDHEARARRVAEAIRQSGNPMALPVFWQDNEAIHQDVLERELILPDDVDPMVKQAALMRWDVLAQQSMMKMPMTAGMGGLAGPPPSPGGSSSQLSPQEQPFQGTNPAIAAGGQTDENTAARQFDKQPH